MDTKRILIVEDDLFLRELYIDTLKAEGYQVEEAVDGEEAFVKLKSGGYDLVFLDIILPKIDGLDIMRKLKTNLPQKANKCVIFLTNLDKSEEIKAAQELGNGYLIKSQINPGTLVEKVKEYLSSS